jgi:hypothetical protein
MRSFGPIQRLQHGMTFWQLLFLVFVFGFFGLLGFQTLPVYLDNLSAVKDIREVARAGDFNVEDPDSVTRSLAKKWDIDYIKYLDYKDIRLVKLKGGRALEYDYEVRKPLFYNIELVMTFRGDVPLAKSVD